MATPKTLTATDLEQGRLTIGREGPDIHVERRYVFLDASSVVITEWGGGRVVEDIAIADLPPAIASALSTIDAWTYNKALEKEGME